MTKARQRKKNQTLRIRHDMMQQDLVNDTTKAVVAYLDERLQRADGAMAALEQQFAQSRQRLMTEDGVQKAQCASHQMRLHTLDRTIYRQNRQLEQQEERRQREKSRNDSRLHAIEKQATMHSWVLGSTVVLLLLTIIVTVGW